MSYISYMLLESARGLEDLRGHLDPIRALHQCIARLGLGVQLCRD